MKLPVYCNYLVEGQPCGKLIAECPPMKVPQVGDAPDKNSQKLVQAVVTHLATKHGVNLLDTWQQFLGFLALAHIRSEDPGYLQFWNEYAAFLAHIVCLPMSDEYIAAAVHGVATDGKLDEQKTVEMVKYIRDFMTRKMTPNTPSTTQSSNTAA